MAEATKPKKLPRWYVPGVPLVALRGGPRDREWWLLQRLQIEQRREAGNLDPTVKHYVATDETAEHRTDDRITAQVWEWVED